MNGREFVDTNVLIYSLDSSEPVKQSLAIQLIERVTDLRVACISLQVLQEFYSAATRKLGSSLSTPFGIWSDWPIGTFTGLKRITSCRLRVRTGKERCRFGTR
jgi:predicted nucleic acid-binding protein